MIATIIDRLSHNWLIIKERKIFWLKNNWNKNVSLQEEIVAEFDTIIVYNYGFVYITGSFN